MLIGAVKKECGIKNYECRIQSGRKEERRKMHESRNKNEERRKGVENSEWENRKRDARVGKQVMNAEF